MLRRRSSPEGGVPDLEHAEHREQASDQRGRGEPIMAPYQRRLEHRQLGPKPRQRRHSSQAQRRNRKQRRQPRRPPRQPAEPVESLAAARVTDNAADEEQVGLHQDVMDHVEDGRAQAQQPHVVVDRRQQPHADHDIADLADDMKTQDPADLALGDGPEHTDDHGCPSGHENHAKQFWQGRKDAAEHAYQRVYADLGEQPGKHR